MTEDYDGVDVVDATGEQVGKVERTYLDDSNVPRYVSVKIGSLFAKHRLIPVEGASLTNNGQLQVPYDKTTVEASPDVPASDTLESVALDGVSTFYAARSDEGSADSSGVAAQGSDESPEAEPVAVPDADASPQAQSNVPQDTDESPETDTEDTDSVSPTAQAQVIDESQRGLRVGDEVPAGLEAPVREVGDVVEVPVLEEVLVKKTVVREILRVKKTDYVEQETVEGDVRTEVIEVDDPSGAVVDQNGNS